MSRRRFGATGASMDAVDDSEVLAGALEGTEGSFELLVRRHTPAVWRLARGLLHDDFAAEEAVQDTFLKAYRGLSGFKGEASPKTWLLSICYRTCMDQLRRRRFGVVPLDELRATSHQERDLELKVLLESAMRGLPQEEREAFVLVHVLDYSREEAASIVGVPASTMRSRVARARTRMAESLSKRSVLSRAVG